MLCALALLLPLASPQEASSLHSDLQEVRSLLDAEDGVAGVARLQELLDDHAGSEEAMLHMGSIQEAMVRGLFLVEQAARTRSSSGDPAPAIPFTARIVSYKEKGGRYQLQWETAEELTDFRLAEEGFLLPIQLDSRFKFTLELSAYPKDGQIEFLSENEEGRILEVECGLAKEGIHRQPAKAYRILDGKRGMLLREEKKLPAPGEKIALTLEGKGNSVQLFMGKK